MENLRRLWHFVISPNYSRTLTILVLLTIAAAVPLTVYVSQQRQELRQRAEHLENDYVCNRPHQPQVGEDVGDCDAENSCTGNLYAQYDHTADTDEDGTANPDDPDDQPYCVNSSCSAPITCPTPTPEPTAVPNTPIPNTPVPNTPVPNTPVPNTPVPPPATATPGTGGPSCPQIFVMWKVGSGNWSSRIDTSLANARQVQGGVFISGGQQPVNNSDIASISFSGPNYSQGAGNPFQFTPHASGTYTITARHKCGSDSGNMAFLNVASTVTTVTPVPRLCLQCVVGGTLQQVSSGCGTSTPNCEAVLNDTPPFFCKGTNEAINESCGPRAPTLTPVPTVGPGTPTPTPSVSPTPPPAGIVSLSLSLSGIGHGTNRNGSPRNPTRPTSLFLFDRNDRLVNANIPITGDIRYQSGDGLFHGSFPIPAAIQPDSYTIKAKTPRYLVRRIPGILTLPIQTRSEVSVPELIAGDIDANNVMDIRDYEIFRSCFERNAASAACGANKDLSDLNDDGVVNLSDYRLLVEEGFQTRRGD